ncbi:hypothetical protein BOTBODRAFT_178371 [Botryobasidium botryosum FD-172 SS1]|uniref:PEP5/VPS11 N-terminal domain-containing protein n=1 Tax=Botryobasidium botryosum (strain FD-172 SS1) TaxID=930990 RepID=A0A067M3N1_BOTB1|nr:hypothetical protein BOTBODRAFT_178371 [Botryobasidium botryosum FD-172 SS1]
MRSPLRVYHQQPAEVHGYPSRPSARDTRTEAVSSTGSTHLHNPPISAIVNNKYKHPVQRCTSAFQRWRQFSLIDATPVTDVHNLGSSPAVFKTLAEISTLGTTSVGVLVADIHASIHVLDREFVAHLGGSVTHLAAWSTRNTRDEATRLPLLKIWGLEHSDKTGLPHLLRSVKVQGGSRPRPVSTITLSHSLSHLAIGLADGTVLLYQHLDQSLFAGSNRLTSLAKPKIILDSATEPITRLGFREPDERPDEDEDEDEDLHLFIVTTDRVLVYLASGKESGGTPAVIDEVGAGLGCAVMDQRAREIVIGPDDAINGPRTRSEHTASTSSSSNPVTVRNAIGRAPNLMLSMSKIVTLFTSTCVAAKLIAYSDAFKDGVRDVVRAWGEISMLCSDVSEGAATLALFAVDSLYSYMIVAAYFTMRALFARGHGLYTHPV